MAIKPLVTLPDAQLRLVSQPVDTITDDIRALADDMLETMYDAPGVGLAAIQIGVPKRIVTIDVAREDEAPEPIVLINPEIIASSEEMKVYQEGCLSIPEYYADVERPDQVTFRYMDLNGKIIEREADGLLSVCVQHELDHLNGVLFIDHLSRLKRELVVRKFTKLAKREGKV